MEINIEQREGSSFAPPLPHPLPSLLQQIWPLGLLVYLSICLSAAVCGAQQGWRALAGWMVGLVPRSLTAGSVGVYTQQSSVCNRGCKVASRGKTQRTCVFNVTVQSLALNYYYYILLAKLSSEWWRQKVLCTPASYNQECLWSQLVFLVGKGWAEH